MSPLRKPFCRENERKIQDRGRRWANGPEGWLTDPLRVNVLGTFKGRNLEEGGLASPGDLQVSEPQSGRVAHKRSHSYVEERSPNKLGAKILSLAAICNRKRFSDWTHTYSGLYSHPTGWGGEGKQKDGEKSIPTSAVNFTEWNLNRSGEFPLEWMVMSLSEASKNQRLTMDQIPEKCNPQF